MTDKSWLRPLLRVAVVVWATFFLLLGVRGLIDPAVYADALGVTPGDAMGKSTIRADLSAFFIVSAVFAALGALPYRDGRRRRHFWLLVPAGLFGTALIGRAIGLADGGLTPAIQSAMIAEAGSVALLLLAWRVIGAHRRS